MLVSFHVSAYCILWNTPWTFLIVCRALSIRSRGCQFWFCLCYLFGRVVWTYVVGSSVSVVIPIAPRPDPSFRCTSQNFYTRCVVIMEVTVQNAKQMQRAPSVQMSVPCGICFRWPGTDTALVLRGLHCVFTECEILCNTLGLYCWRLTAIAGSNYGSVTKNVKHRVY